MPCQTSNNILTSQFIYFSVSLFCNVVITVLSAIVAVHTATINWSFKLLNSSDGKLVHRWISDYSYLDFNSMRWNATTERVSCIYATNTRDHVCLPRTAIIKLSLKYDSVSDENFPMANDRSFTSLIYYKICNWIQLISW